MSVTTPRPPAHLSRAAKAMWRATVEDYGLAGEPHALRVLTMACEASDRAEQARVALAQHGTTYVDRFGCPKARPEVAIERDARIATARLLRELSLDGDAPTTRVPRVGGGRS